MNRKTRSAIEAKFLHLEDDDDWQVQLYLTNNISNRNEFLAEEKTQIVSKKKKSPIYSFYRLTFFCLPSGFIPILLTGNSILCTILHFQIDYSVQKCYHMNVQIGYFLHFQGLKSLSKIGESFLLNEAGRVGAGIGFGGSIP